MQFSARPEFPSENQARRRARGLQFFVSANRYNELVVWQPSSPLLVSSSEQVLLEAILESEEIPEPVKKRVRVVQLAAQGVANCVIAKDVGMARTGVVRWRLRFLEKGVRGLWDVETDGPREKIPEAVEQAIVEDCFYRPRLDGRIFREMIYDPSVNWNVRSLARRHRVSPATVQRVWKKYGIRMRRIHRLDAGLVIPELKISMDPLFGTTVYEVGGLYGEGPFRQLVFCTRDRPLSEVTFSNLDLESREELVEELVRRLAALRRSSVNRRQWEELLLGFLAKIVMDPRHAGSEFHVISDLQYPSLGVSPSAPSAFAKSVRITSRPMPTFPFTVERWIEWVEQWLWVISRWPMQQSLVESITRLCQFLERFDGQQQLAIWLG